MGSQCGRERAAVAGMSDYVLRLTPEQARQCADEVHAAAPAEGAEAVAFLTAVFPTRDQP